MATAKEIVWTGLAVFGGYVLLKHVVSPKNLGRVGKLVNKLRYPVLKQVGKRTRTPERWIPPPKRWSKSERAWIKSQRAWKKERK